MKQVSKIFIRTGEFYIFSRKRAPGHRKDGRLELLGGTLEAGESPFEALVREANEEENSGLLADEVLRQRPEPETVVLCRDDIEEPQHIFRIEIDSDTAGTLEADPEESYGLEHVQAELFDSDKDLSGMRDRFTPKTLAILLAMGRDI